MKEHRAIPAPSSLPRLIFMKVILYVSKFYVVPREYSQCSHRQILPQAKALVTELYERLSL